MVSILERIVQSKLRDIADAKVQVPEEVLCRQLPSAPAVRDFFAALSTPGPIHLIAEVKKASPSQGLLRAEFDPVALAMAYERGGAACVSVLTETPHFQGRLSDLSAVRHAVSLPVLRKDFLLDAYQVFEARCAGADAVLLIAECLDDCNLRKLFNLTLELGMTPLVELYEPENCGRALDAGAKLIGVNNRDLRTFEVNLEHTIRMKELLPDDCVLVAESGIRGRQDAERLQAAGVDAMLVGEHLVVQPDPEKAVRMLLDFDQARNRPGE